VNFTEIMTKVKIARFLKRFVLVSLILVLLVEGFLYLRPLPALQPTVTIKSPQQSSSAALPWPSYGQAALGAEGFGVLEAHGPQKSAPIASVAKVMTAYSVLKAKPLSKGQQGPMITVTDQDVNTYNDYYGKGGSVARVVAGEQISEYQALQAMMLPSANNFADLLANWGFGSLDKYIVYANNQAKALGLKDTHISDASGFSPQTLSNTQDLVVLGEAAIKNPVIADIVSQQQATIPEAGTIRNVNWLLGTNNINGIKTGDTDEAGGCYLFSSVRNIGGKNITLVGAIMSAPTLNTAIHDTVPLISASDQGFKVVNAVKAGQVVGYYKMPWGGQVPVTAKEDLSFLTWQRQAVSISTKLNPLQAPQSKNAVAGSITAKANQQSVATQAVLAQNIHKPSWKWRIFDR
jgi:D-alanyl-D-alanine carboxypeptidase (penicillin-binding protein 5/6)